MKTKRSILHQLMINILFPVLLLFSSVFIVVYKYQQFNLNRDIANRKENIISETKNLITYYDFSIHQHEATLIEYMKEKSRLLEEKLKPYSIQNAPLKTLEAEIGMDTINEDIYLIDSEAKIINTTFLPDLGLDFKQLDPTFAAFFNGIKQKGTFKDDRFGLELKTGRIRKYSYYPVKKGNYIIEIGLYSETADDFKALLLQKIKSLSHRYPSIDNVTLYLGVKNVVDVSIKDSLQAKAYLKCLNEKKKVILEDDDPKTSEKEQKEFIFLPVLDANMYAGYVLEVETNDLIFKELLSNLFADFLILFVIVILVLSTIVYIRSKKITKPITLLANEAKGITSENLGKHINISGSKEIDELASSFNGMMDNLRVSYETLEDKVIERTTELEQQKRLVEEKNEEIVDSIQYAKFIQEALLPSENDIKSAFPESMIYYAPKDIIAGDFYWFEKRKDSYWIAVADCTGHGVPGAMVSVLCVNAMNQTCFETDITETGKFLDSVKEKVVKTLTKESRSVKDGMDISLCKYHPETNTLEWSGANNPLWILREEEVIILSPDKQPIGFYEDSKAFSTQTFICQKNDLLVLFSDGYADQFGGPKNKKFKYATLKTLLQEHKDLSMDQLHERLKTTFENWKGNLEQTDDVCLLLIRI